MPYINIFCNVIVFVLIYIEKNILYIMKLLPLSCNSLLHHQQAELWRSERLAGNIILPATPLHLDIPLTKCIMSNQHTLLYRGLLLKLVYRNTKRP